MLLFDYLFTVVPELDCRFTVERLGEGAALTPGLELVTGRTAASAKSIEALMVELKLNLSGLDVRQDKATPMIIHLVDKRVSGMHDYPLDRDVSVDFRGYIDSLPDAIGKSFAEGRIKSHPSFIIPPMTFVDGITVVDVHAKSLPVRQVLTDCVPLKNYSRVLWVAEIMGQETDNPAAEVWYFGPKRPANPPAAAPRPKPPHRLPDLHEA